MTRKHSRKSLSSRAKLLVRCLRCRALHNPWLRWVRGYYRGDTTDSFTATGTIPGGVCPLCRAPIVSTDRVSTQTYTRTM